LTFLKKRARQEGEENDDGKRIELLPGGGLKPVKRVPN
jgi:hypothetical protein